MKTKTGLNPCFNGRYSQRYVSEPRNIRCGVLILVLMEDTLRGIVRNPKNNNLLS